MRCAIERFESDAGAGPQSREVGTVPGGEKCACRGVAFCQQYLAVAVKAGQGVTQLDGNCAILLYPRGLLQSLQKFSEVYLPRQQIENRARIFDPVPVA